MSRELQREDSGGPISVERWTSRKASLSTDGRSNWCRISTACLRDPEGREIGVGHWVFGEMQYANSCHNR